MNSTKIQKQVLFIILALSLAFALAQNANASQSSDCEQTKKMANEVIDRLIAKDFEGVRKNFNENMKQNLSVEQLKAVWTGVIAEKGEYKSREKSLYQEYPDNTAIFTQIEMAKGKLVVEVRFGTDGKIGGLWIRPV